MPAKPRGERGWWLERERASGTGAWAFSGPAARRHSLWRKCIALWRLAQRHRREIAALWHQAMLDEEEIADLREKSCDPQACEPVARLREALDEARAGVERLREALDEARAGVERLREEAGWQEARYTRIDRLCTEACGRASDEIENAVRAERERDEARAKLARVREWAATASLPASVTVGDTVAHPRADLLAILDGDA